MREIKFRAWDKRMKEMFNNVFLAGCRIYKNKPLMWIEHDNGFNKLFQGELMQFTGLKDKNGKEIYEGDIVKYMVGPWEQICEVYFSDGMFKVKTDTLAWECGNDPVTIEVIGNIYENPELLNEGEKE